MAGQGELTGTLHDADGVVTVNATRAGGRFVLAGKQRRVAIPVGKLRRGAATAMGVILHHADRPDWRLFLDHVPADSWVRNLPLPGTAARRRRWPMVAGAVVVAAMATGITWRSGDTATELTAPLLPHRVTDPIGKAYLAEIGAACTGRDGARALARLADSLMPAGGLPEPITISVVDVPDVNAVALPGGHLAIYRGLIDSAASPDEVAGALAHELGHVVKQHPNQSLIKQMGPAVLARTLGIDAGTLPGLTIILHGSVAAEGEADGEAIGILRGARVSTEGAANFFDRSASAAPTANTDFPDSHPPDATRAARYRAAVVPGTHPSMSASDWQALRSICT